mmetsp:Transcript_39544/g.99692  ORF Transcript_39544/g.99692 Transcript_39544/m.99692 type:complete len:214 (-) Transcript_39544:1124-1765(-)
MDMPICVLRASVYTAPESSDSSVASSSRCASMRSARRYSKRPRSRAFMLPHGPRSNAIWAANTARLTSSAEALSTSQMRLSSAGLMLRNLRSPPVASQKHPSMNSWCGKRSVMPLAFTVTASYSTTSSLAGPPPPPRTRSIASCANSSNVGAMKRSSLLKSTFSRSFASSTSRTTFMLLPPAAKKSVSFSTVHIRIACQILRTASTFSSSPAV